jgi:hypothetical protein
MFKILITEERQTKPFSENAVGANPTIETIEIYMRRIDEIDLGAICTAIDKKPRKPRADRGTKKGAQS